MKDRLFKIFLVIYFLFPILFGIKYIHSKLFVKPVIENAIKKYLENKSDIYLYPGYVIKENGKLFWCAREPVYNNKWEKDNFVEVTNCIYDPFPYSSGSKETIIKINNK
jgi:hypothetical protein